MKHFGSICHKHNVLITHSASIAHMNVWAIATHDFCNATFSLYYTVNSYTSKHERFKYSSPSKGKL